MSDESIFINRELSWLDFNRRVLALGKDKNVPLGERIKFLAIYGSNLDEFFMVRVGSLQERANLEQSKTKKEKRENKTNMTAAEQLAAIMPKTAQLQEECDKFYAKALENLAENGYHKVDFDHLTKEEEHLWKKYFQSELFPILSPQIVDNRHPFPFLRNKEIYLGVLLKEKHTQEQSLGIVPISSQMERLHFIKKDGAVQFALTEELVLHYASSIFGKDSIQEKCLFRVTRNADIDVKEGMMDHDIDYREIMTELLRRRRKLAAVRLQITPAPAPEVERLLCSRLELTRKRVFLQKSPLDLSFFFKLSGRMEAEGHPALFYAPARPMLPPPDYDLAAEVQKHDVLLSYPYQSIRPFIAMLKKAAQDPDPVPCRHSLPLRGMSAPLCAYTPLSQNRGYRYVPFVQGGADHLCGGHAGGLLPALCLRSLAQWPDRPAGPGQRKPLGACENPLLALPALRYSAGAQGAGEPGRPRLLPAPLGCGHAGRGLPLSCGAGG